jgi:flavorubredoxin
MFGNTEKIAKALAAGLKSGGATVNVVKVGSFNSDQLTDVDLLCVGSPTHAWNASTHTKEFLEKLKSAPGTKGKKAFSFDTKMKSRLAGNASGKIEKKLEEAGLTTLRPRESAIVLKRDGPLENGAEETFQKIGTELAKLL